MAKRAVKKTAAKKAPAKKAVAKTANPDFVVPDQLPSVGRIVHYAEPYPKSSDGEPVQILPALVTRVLAEEFAPGVVNLTIFPDKEDWPYRRESVPYGTGHKHWSWPPRK